MPKKILKPAQLEKVEQISQPLVQVAESVKELKKAMYNQPDSALVWLPDFKKLVRAVDIILGELTKMQAIIHDLQSRTPKRK